MCLSPYSKPNPNYGVRNGIKEFTCDTESRFIEVPCGHCTECIAVKQMYLVQRVQIEAQYNYIYFTTLTYNNDCLPVITTSSGYDIRYADVHDIQLLFKQLRNKKVVDRGLRYFAVSELGSKKGRPHFHILWFIPKKDGDDEFVPLDYEKILKREVLANWKKNTGSRRSPVYTPRCTYIAKYIGGRLKTNYDTHYVRPRGFDDCTSVAFYCLKYMLKPSDRAVRLQQALRLNLDDDEYESTWSLVRPRWCASKGFGLNGRMVSDWDLPGDDGAPVRPKMVADDAVVSSLRDMVKSTPKMYPYPVYKNIAGDTFPLSPYYRRRGDVFTLYDAYDFALSHEHPDIEMDSQTRIKKWYELQKKASQVDSHDNACDDLDLLYGM